MKKHITYGFIITLFHINLSFIVSSCDGNSNPSNKMMVRMAELQIEEHYLEEYLKILKEESRASIALEPGVICIYPMYESENPTQIKLLEIYSDTAAYQAHLQSSHFLKYKKSTLKMVKSLKLVEMDAIDQERMPEIFRKLE